MDVEIEPMVGIRGLSLGATKQSVREFFGKQPTVFQRTHATNPSDCWTDKGVFAYYTSDDKLEALEFALPADAKLNGTSLNIMTMEQAIRLLQTLDQDTRITEAGAGALSHVLGVGLWCPTPDEKGANVESVLVFGDGYFDKPGVPEILKP